MRRNFGTWVWKWSGMRSGTDGLWYWGSCGEAVRDPALLFDGHTDTHPVEDYLGDPFEPRIEDGRLYGRGSVDMKGGLAAMMRAAGRLKSCREKLAGSLIVAAVRTRSC